MNIYSWILTLSILAGQLVKIPIGQGSGATLLDMSLIFLCLIGLIRIKFHLKTPPLFIKTGLIFILIAIVSLIFSPLSLNANQYLVSFFYTIRFLLIILLGWLIASRAFPFFSKSNFNLLTFSGIGLAILGLLQFIFIPDLYFLEQYGWDPHVFRTVSTFLDPSFAGAYFVLTLILLLQKPLKVQIKWQAVTFILVYLALLTTISRGAYLMFTTSFIAIAFLNKSLKLTILTLLLSIGLFLGYYTYHLSVAAPRNIDRVQSAQFRVNSWKRGWEIFTHAPFLGVGYNSYRYALREYHLAPENHLATKGANSNDSSLLHILSTTGIIGLLAYLLFLASLFWPIKPEKIIMISALVGLIAHSFFANSLVYPFLFLWIMLAATKITDD